MESTRRKHYCEANMDYSNTKYGRRDLLTPLMMSLSYGYMTYSSTQACDRRA